MLNTIFGDSFPSIRTVSTVHIWVTDFKCGLSSYENSHRGRSNEVPTPEIIQKIHKIVIMDNHQLKLCDIAKIVGIFYKLLHNILYEYLDMKKLCAP